MSLRSIIRYSRGGFVPLISVTVTGMRGSLTQRLENGL